MIDNWPAKVWGDWRKELDLHSFASANDHGKVTVLLENGVDVDGRNQEGKTALMLAKNQETAEALIKGGADIHAVDANGKTPLWHGTQHLIKMIKRNNNGGMTKIPVHECGLVIEIIKKGGLFDDPFALQSAKLLDRRLNKGLEIECWDGQENLEDFKLVRPALDVILAMGRRERLDNLMSAGVKKQRMKNQNVKPPRM